MSWFKVCDSFACHPKVEALENSSVHAYAIAAWTIIGADCGRRMTDGHFTDERLKRCLPWSKNKITSAKNELLRVNLWEKVEGGYRFHAWCEYNPTRESVESARKSQAESKRRHREKNRESKNVLVGQNNREDAVNIYLCDTTPTRPDPSHYSLVKRNVVELQRRDESRPVTLENIFPALDEKNIPGGETPPSLDSADAGGPGLPPVAAPPHVVCRSPVSIAGAQCHQESIIGEETSGCSASKAESIIEPHKRSRAKAQKASASPEVDAVFCYWKKITGSEKAQLSDARAKRIEWAIKTYGVDECKACIDGYGSSDFHRGINDRQTPYLDLTLWFRDETKFEAGLALSKTPSAQRIRRNRVPTTRKEFLAAARESAQFFWDTKETLGVDSEPRNQGWNEWVYRFVHAAIVTPYRRYVCGDAVGEDVLWAAFNAELDAYEVSPVEIHPGILEKRIAASVDEWKAARIFAVDSGQEQATSEVQA